MPPNEMINYQSPLRLPYYKKGVLHLKRQMEEHVQTLQGKAAKAKEDFIQSLPEWIRKRINSPPADLPLSIEGEESAESLLTNSTTHPALSRFNQHGRIDFAIEKSLLENSYLAAIRTHFSYWEDIDVASFIAVELACLPAKPLYPI